MTRRRVRIRLEDPALPLLEQRRIRGRNIALDEASLATVEMLDAHERAAGGRWREAHTLAPGEVVIRDERLTQIARAPRYARTRREHGQGSEEAGEQEAGTEARRQDEGQVIRGPAPRISEPGLSAPGGVMERVRFTREDVEDMLARARRGGHYGINAGLVEALAAQLLEYMAAYAAQREVGEP